jgi:ubiquinone/menaquinone biosynthesis C-methylase UbiE
MLSVLCCAVRCSSSLMWCNYSKIANEYDQRNADAIVQIERSIQERIPFIGIKQDGRLLDYACGTGMLSRVSCSFS